MADYNSYPTMMQSSQPEYVNSDAMEANSNQISNNSNNNIIYNSAPLIVLNSQKSDMTMLQNTMQMNDGHTYVTIQTQPGNGSADLNGAKLINTPIIIQNSQYQQQQSQQQQNTTQMTSLTPSQLQSLSYLMQTQIAPQFIQTSNGLIQIIPQGFIASQQQQNQTQAHDHGMQAQINGLPTIGWSLGNFGSNNGSNGNTNNQIALDNQLQPLHVNSLSLPQLVPVQHVLQTGGNSFFSSGGSGIDQEQLVSAVVDLNGRKASRSRKKRPATVSTSTTLATASPPSSTCEVAREAAQSSGHSQSTTPFDNKGRPFAFLCPDCPKRFTLNSRLSAHMRCHTGMRPFTCAVCGFSFTQKSYLIRHAAVHKEERPFHCERCQKSYKHYGSLANHRKLHRKQQQQMEGDGRGEGDDRPLYDGRAGTNLFFQDIMGSHADGLDDQEEIQDEDEEDQDDFPGDDGLTSQHHNHHQHVPLTTTIITD